MNFLAGLLLGFIIGCGLTFYYFRTRWLNIKGKLENGKLTTSVDVEQALFEQLMPSEKGEFIIVNQAEVIMRDATGDITLDKVLKQDE